MWPRSGPSNIIVLKAKSIVVYNTKDSSVSRAFPEYILARQEVTKQDELRQALTDFFSKNKVNGKSLILLSNEIVYQKQFTPPITDGDPRLSEFISEIPFDPEQLSHCILSENNVSSVFVVNKELPEAVRNSLKIQGDSTYATVPMQAYQKTFHDPLTEEEIKLLRRDRIVPFRAEILEVKKSKPALIWFSVFLFVSLIVGAIAWLLLNGLG